MELETSIVLAVTAVVLSCIALAMAKAWLRTNEHSIRMMLDKEYAGTIAALQDDLDKAHKSIQNYAYRMQRIRRDWDFDPEPGEEIDPELEPDLQISELAKLIYPKLPPAVSKLIDSPALQDAIAKTAQKNPDLIGRLIDRFLPESSSNTLGNSSINNPSTNQKQEYV